MLKCLRCTHEWQPRTDHKPLSCPQCHSRVWDKPKVEPYKYEENKLDPREIKEAFDRRLIERMGQCP